MAGELREYESIEMPNVGGMPGIPGPTLKEWKNEAKRRADKWNRKTDSQKEQEAAQNEKEANELFEWERRQLEKLERSGASPTSQTPAQNPPKNFVHMYPEGVSQQSPGSRGLASAAWVGERRDCCTPKG